MEDDLKQADENASEFHRAVMITYLSYEAVWDCYHIQDAHGLHEHAEFDSLEEAITWGRERCRVVRVWDPESATAPEV